MAQGYYSSQKSSAAATAATSTALAGTYLLHNLIANEINLLERLFFFSIEYLNFISLLMLPWFYSCHEAEEIHRGGGRRVRSACRGGSSATACHR